MRILAFCPFELEIVGGNVVTLKRVRKAVTSRGHEFEIVTVTPEMGGGEARARVREFRPDVVHLYHAYKTGRLLPDLDGMPAVVTLSGTDLNLDWDDPAKRPALERALDGAGRILTYNLSMREKLRRLRPAWVAKLEVIPKGVDAGEAPYDLRGTAGVEPEAILFLLPGGIRPVKNNLFAAEGLAGFVRAGLPVRLVYAGPVLDRFYGKMFRQRLDEDPWIRHLEAIPHESMLTALRQSDVVLNTSQSEGISNALMEAMWAGRTILASDIPGNRDLLQDGRTGVLFHKGNFEAKAERLIREPAWREALGRAAADHARANFSSDREADAILEAYRLALKR